MARMIRKQIYITDEQDRLLKQRAREQDASEAEVIRDILDETLTSEDEKESRRRAAWERLKAFMDERAKLQVPQTGRTWTRDELYDERPKYLSRRQ